MSDLIERDDAIKVAKSFLRNDDEWFQEALASQIRMIPSAESTGDLDNAIYEYVQDGLMSNPYDRPQGEWIYRTDVGWHATRQCSLCGWMQSYSDTKYMGYRYKYCPNCGARMFAKDTNVPNKKGADDEDN